MEKKLKEKIIKEYLSGKGSTTIEKEIGISKPKILKILNDSGIIRKRDRCKSLNIIKEGNFYYVERVCPECKKIIKTKSKDQIIACRNHFNKVNKTSLCKKCSLKLQVGEGNPFYGKKHTKESKNKISKSRKGKSTGKNNAMSNNFYREKARFNLIKRWESGELETTRKKCQKN